MPCLYINKYIIRIYADLPIYLYVFISLIVAAMTATLPVMKTATSTTAQKATMTVTPPVMVTMVTLRHTWA